MALAYDPNTAWREADARRRQAQALDDQRKADAARAAAQNQEAWRTEERRKEETARAQQQAAAAAAQQPINNAMLKRAMVGGVLLAVAAGVAKGIQNVQALQVTAPKTEAPSLLRELKEMFKPSAPQPMPTAKRL